LEIGMPQKPWCIAVTSLIVLLVNKNILEGCLFYNKM
jgi:hypothetical protein